MKMMGGFAFWLLVLVVVLFFFGGCGRGWLRGGGCHAPGWYGPAPQPPEPTETPKQILDRRLAKGEITPEEYRRLLKELNEV